MSKWGSVVAAAAWLAGAAAADIINVPGDYPTIQAAIDAAVDGDEVVIADGVYTGPGNRDIDFGGRLITVRSAGGPANCIIDCQGGLPPQDWHRGFFFHTGETAAAVVEGLTIRNGSVGGFFPTQSGSGGGIRCDNASPTIANCIITQCAVYAHDCCAYGGGIAIFGGSPVILDCTITSNSAGESGGGIYGGSPTVIGCMIANNGSTGGFGGLGGGIYAGALTITDCDVIGNSANYGGGIVASTATVLNCRIEWNNSSGEGGGLVVYANALIANCVITANSANPSFVFGGGGIACGGSTTISNCTVAYNSSSVGGGIKASGAATLRNTIVWGNIGNEGTQIATSPNAVLTIAHCDVQCGPTDILLGNGAQLILGAGNICARPMFVAPSAAGDLRLRPDSPCIDAGHNWAIAGIAETDLDDSPRFADGPADDTGCGVPVIVDMGAYEVQGKPFTVRLGDIEGDGAVGVTDFLHLLGEWGPCRDECCLSDLDFDGEVGIADFLLLLGNWG